MVYRLAFSQTRDKSSADDIYQEVFLRYIRKKPQFKTEAHKKAWFIRVTINCCKKMWASPWKKKIVSLDETIVFETEEETSLHYELQKLPTKYRTVIHLFYYEDMSIEEISKSLNQKPSTVRTQLTRARYKLKEILKEEDYFYDI
jgi:RNA polymerase sigma-70 factor (ECF subfamily)